MKAAVARALGLALALAAVSCNQRGAVVYLVVDMDFRLPSPPELYLQSFTVEPDGGLTPLLESDEPIGTGEGQYCLPASVGAYTARRDLTRTVLLRLSESREEPGLPPPCLRRSVQLQLDPSVSASEHLVNVRLTSACAAPAPAGMSCPANAAVACLGRAVPRGGCTMSQACEVLGQTCGDDGRCRAVGIAPAEVLPVPASGVPRPDCRYTANLGDAAPMDATADARTEASAPDVAAPRDGGMDAPGG